MKIGKFSLLFIILTSIVLSCSKNNNNATAAPVLRDRTEQQAEDDIILEDYLSSYYYNSADLQANPNPSMKDLVITALPADGVLPDPDKNTLLIDAVETHTTTFSDTEYKYYVLKIAQGGGEKAPHFCDQVRVLYQGFLPNDDNKVFDESPNPTDFYLIGDGVNTQGVITGWRKVLTEFNMAASYTDNGDGTVTYTNPGVGAMFLPSGLAYFSEYTSNIPPYAVLAFKFDLLETSVMDHDNDGVPSYLEDLNSDNEFVVDYENRDSTTDDDTDGDGTPDFLDADDDGDGVLTINEDTNNDGDPTNDIGANGIPKYLDATETASNK
ncbi:FKBP-type peptidyl-prolyl cis-trans isomerase [Gaetbulibacter aestuarii]|uniref:peptidylprolyl isomerase n=1 Tax=Gaetbulibacter aestuarii TaxID=1502358 RepID=A0ABW7N2E0_9FLAO